MTDLGWALRPQFPLLAARPDLIYLDNAATTQKPQRVLDRVMDFYTMENSNVHRGVYALAHAATEAYEAARATIAAWIHAARPQECVFTRGTTSALNLVAHGLRAQIQPGDTIVVSHMEHHANFLPWQRLAAQTGARLTVIPLTPDGDLDLTTLPRCITHRTRIVAVTHVSNVLGTVNALGPIRDAARAFGAYFIVDGAQAAAHLPIDVQALDCDFYAFSGHKVYGPTGIGVLYGKASCLEQLDPLEVGGEMVEQVTLERTTYAPVPARLEAGTPPIAAAIGLAEAVRFIQDIGFSAITTHEAALQAALCAGLEQIPLIRILGAPRARTGVFAFHTVGIHPHDIATALDADQIAIRAGQLCAHPLLRYYGFSSLCRISFGIYNDLQEIPKLLEALSKILTFFGRAPA